MSFRPAVHGKLSRTTEVVDFDTDVIFEIMKIDAHCLTRVSLDDTDKQNSIPSPF